MRHVRRFAALLSTLLLLLQSLGVSGGLCDARARGELTGPTRHRHASMVAHGSVDQHRPTCSATAGHRCDETPMPGGSQCSAPSCAPTGALVASAPVANTLAAIPPPVGSAPATLHSTTVAPEPPPPRA